MVVSQFESSTVHDPLRPAKVLLIGWPALLVAVVIAGFLAGALGLWAAILWAVVLVAGIGILIRRRAGRA
jgi:hypothetical protein